MCISHSVDSVGTWNTEGCEFKSHLTRCLTMDGWRHKEDFVIEYLCTYVHVHTSDEEVELNLNIYNMHIIAVRQI